MLVPYLEAIERGVDHAGMVRLAGEFEGKEVGCIDGRLALRIFDDRG